MAIRPKRLLTWALVCGAGISANEVALCQTTSASPLPNQAALTEPIPSPPPGTSAPAQAASEAGIAQLPAIPISPALPTQTTQPLPHLSTNDGNTGMSSRPPIFTIPQEASSSDPAAPTVTNDSRVFAGFPDVQGAFSSLLPGNFKDTKYKWYGFVRVDGIFDFKPMGSTDMFVTSTIPVPQGKGQNYVLTPRYTRLGFDTSTPMPENEDWTIKTRIELDFFNGNTSGAFGSFPPRLRFAWVDVGPFLIGQAASLFMDYDVFPNVLDYEGPPSMVLMRQPIVAVRLPVTDNIQFAVGVEQPYSDIQWQEGQDFVVNPGTGIITDPGVAKNIQRMPDITTNIRYAGDYGHMQVAGILRRLSFQTEQEQTYNATGAGVNLTGSINPWAVLNGVPRNTEGASPIDKCRFLGQFATGRGITRYFQDENGLGLDATFDRTNRLNAIPGMGWFIAYEHWWTNKVISVFTYGKDRLSLTDSLPDNTYKAANYATGNLIWLPFERFGLGIEFIYGSRENKDGQKGDNYRIQTSAQYRF